MSVTNTVLPRL